MIINRRRNVRGGRYKVNFKDPWHTDSHAMQFIYDYGRQIINFIIAAGGAAIEGFRQIRINL